MIRAATAGTLIVDGCSLANNDTSQTSYGVIAAAGSTIAVTNNTFAKDIASTSRRHTSLSATATVTAWDYNIYHEDGSPAVYRGPGVLEAHCHVGHVMLDRLEGADRLTELGTLVDIGNHYVHAGLHDAERPGG